MTVHSIFDSTPVQVAGNLTAFLALVFWLGLAFWTYRDAHRRLADQRLVGASTIVALVIPFLGALVYMLFRPPETLAEAHAREVELRALEERFVRPIERCPVCHAEAEPEFLVCPVCTTRLRNPCRECDAALDPLWQVCPYCTTPTAPTLEPVADDLDTALSREAVVAPRTRRRRNAGSRPAA